MKFVALNHWLIGRPIVPKRSETIVLPGAISKGVTRCYLIESVSKGAVTKDGYEPKPGDLLIAQKVGDLTVTKEIRTAFSVDEVFCRVENYSLDDFVDLENKPVTPVHVPVNGNGAPEIVGAPA